MYVVLFYNITHFAEYNSRRGMDAGDALLRGIGRILTDTFPEGMVSHFDGDHFTVLLEDSADLDAAVNTSYEKILKILDRTNVQDCRIGGYRWTSQNIKAEKACSYAKRACDSIDRTGSTHFIYFSDQLKKKDEMEEYVLAHIDKAIDKGWIEVYYQPVIRTLTGRLCSMEALSRWNDPFYGMMSPAQFIEPLARNGLIWKLDQYVLHEIGRRYADCVKKGIPAVPVSFNLDRQDFFAMDIFLEVENTVRKYQMPRDYLRIEVTERVFASRNAVIDTALKRFHQAGYAIWIDDFGSGYSTFNLLKDYQYDMLKIDMAFMRAETERSRAIVCSIVQMNDRLDGTSLCEGVETKEQYEFLRSIGCDMVQGFYFSSPQPYEKLMAILKEKGISPETRKERNYYNGANTVPFDTDTPFAIVETDGRRYRFLYHNDLFAEEAVGADLSNDVKTADAPGRKLIHAVLHHSDGTPFQYMVDDRLLEIRAVLLNTMGSRKLLSIEIHDITASDEVDQSVKGTAYHHILHLFDDAYAVNLQDDVIADAAHRHVLIRGVDQAIQQYARQNIQKEDQDAYLAYFQPERISKEVKEKQTPVFRSCFRTRGKDGSYIWKEHILLYLPVGNQPGFLYGTVNLQREVRIMYQADETAETSCQIGEKQLLSNLLKKTDLPGYLKDNSRRYVMASSSYAALCHRPVMDLIGRTDEELGLPSDLFSLEEDVLHHGRHVSGLHTCRKVQGEIQDARVYLQPVYQDGAIVGLIGCVDLLNNAERENGWKMVQALAIYEQAYQAKEEKYAFLLVQNLNGFDEKTAAAMEQITAGRGISQLISNQLYGVLMNYEKKEEIAALSDQLFNTDRKNNRIEVRDERELHGTETSLGEKLIRGIFRKDEQDLMEDEKEISETVRMMMDRSILGTYIVSSDRTILYWNDAAEKITGYPREFMVGRKCSETSLEHIDEAGCHLCSGYCPFLKVFAENEPVSKDVYLHRKDGSLLKVRTFFTPLVARDGTVLKVLEQFCPLE